MGRILSGGVNSSVTGGGTLQNLSTVMVTGEAVVQGQLACVGGDGLAYYTLDPLAPGGALRPANGSAAPAPGLPFAAGPGVSLPWTSAYGAGCVLSNGNAVLVGTVSNMVQFGIYSPLGVQQGGLVTLSRAAVASINFYAVALSGGGFAIAYLDQGTTAATVAIFNNAGTQILAPTIVEPGVYATSLGIAPLSGGGLAIAYCTNAGAVRYAVLSASGVVVQAPAAAGLTGVLTSSACAISVGALTSGGFVIAGLPINNSAAFFSRFNAAGVAQQTGISAFSGNGSTATSGTVSVVGLATGSFIIVQYSNVAAGTFVTTFSAAGAALGAVYNTGGGMGNTTTPAFTVAARTDGNALVSTQGYLFIATSAGTMGAQVSLGGAYGNAVTQVEGGLVLAFAASGSIEVRDANLGLISTLQCSALGIGSAVANTTPASLLAVGRSPVKSGIPLAMVMTPGGAMRSVTLALNGYAITKTTPVGVFGASAAAGSSVPVQYQGVATLAAGFAQPFSIDANSAVPPGQRMAIVGNQAVLSGIQPPQSRRQIN